MRADLDPVEQARGYARLQDEFGLSHADVADRRRAQPHRRRQRDAAARPARTTCSQLLERGELSEGHGRALLQIEGQDERRETARAVVAAGLSVRQTEALARTRGRAAPRRPPAAPDWFDAELANDAVDGLYRTLGIAARVAPDRAGCRVELRLRSAAQLAELVERLAALDAAAERV